MRVTTTADSTRKYSVHLARTAAVAVVSRTMASNPDSPNAIYRWIEKKPLTEAVKWTSREKFWLITATCNYGTSDWKSVAQVVKNAGEPYRPNEWYTPKSCEHQFKIIISNATKELKSMSLIDMMQHVAGNLQKDYVRDSIKSKEILKTKYCKLLSIMNRLKQGNLSRQEVINLYSQAKKYENEGKQYMEQLMMRQKASLASENSSSGLSEEPVKWNTTPSAPLLTSLLRSRNTIPVNRPVTSNNSLLPSPVVGTSRTRSGKLLPLSSSVKITQGTPTLSKLLEAPANPYIPNSPQSIQKNNQNEVVTDKLVGNTKKDNSQSTSLNRVDNVTFPESLTKFDIIASKRQSSKSPVSAVKNGPKANLNIVNLLSDSENDEGGKSPIQNIQPKNLFGEKKDITSSRIETRATRSQTRAEVSFKQLNDSKVSDGRKDQETLRQHSTQSQPTGAHSVADQLINIDQTDVEPLSSGQDVMLNQTSPKTTRSSMQRLRPTENLSATRVNTKKINNQLLGEISTNFVLNSSIKNVATEYKNVMVGQSQIDNANISGCLIPIESSSVIKDTIILRKDGQLEGKFFKQNSIIELKGTNPICNDIKNDTKLLSFANQPIVVVNKIKTPYNIKLSGFNADNIRVANNDAKKTVRLNNSSQNFIPLLDGNCSLSDEVIVIDDDVNINIDTLTKTKELSSNAEKEILPLISIDANNSSLTSANSKSSEHQLDVKKLNDKTPWNMFGKTKNILNVPSKKLSIRHTTSKTGSNSTIKEDTNNRFIKELDFDFDQSISQTSLSELYNGVEEIVQMHSFDNEELNSLIECGSSSLGNETEVHQNSVSLDHGDSSVSESDSTIGAFDTFAQITRVPQNLSSKDIKSASKDSVVVIQDVKDSERDEGFVQSDEIDDEQTSIVPVTGIPILQGVISDVMSKIDSDRVAALNAVEPQETHIDDIVEISSDDDVEIVGDDDKHADDCQGESYKLEKLKEASIKEKIKNINYECAREALNIIKEIEKTYSSRYKQNKSDITPVRGVYTIQESTTTMKTQEMENTLSEKEIELQVHKNAGMELKIVKDNEDKLLQINKMRQENKFKEGEMKNAKEIEFKKIAEEKSQCEIASKNTKEKLLREAEERKIKEDEEKIIQEIKLKEVEKNKFAAETMKRFKETESKKEIENELKRIEIKKMKETEMKRIKEAEMKKANEAEIQKIKEDELLKRAGEEAIKTRKAQEHEIQKAKEAEIQRAKEIELQRAKEAEIQRVKEAEIQRAKEAEMQRAKEAEMQRAKEAEMQRAKEAEVQRAKEEEMRIAKEVEAKKAKEAELIKAKENEIRKAKEAEIMKAKEDELRKAKEIEQKNALEADMKEKQKIIRIKEAELKKIKDAEIKEAEKIRNNAMEIEISKLIDAKEKLSSIIMQKEELLLSKKSKKTVIERPILETKKTNDKKIENKESEVEGSKSKEQEIKKVFENEKKIVKEDEIKIITRTRGLKPEEKCKDINIVSHNALSNNSGTSTESLEQSSSNISLTNVESPSTSSDHDGRKQIKYLDSVNKRKTSDTNNITGDLSARSSESVRKENNQLVRTRSSSSVMQCQQLEIKLTPFYSGEYEIGTTSKTTVETKTRTPTNLNIPRNSETIIMESPAKALFDSKCGKQLTVSVVKLSPNEVAVQKEKGDQHSDSNSVKQLNNKTENNEETVSPKTINVNKTPFTLSLRRCARKRGISAQNDQIQQSKSDKSTLQNGSTTLIGKSSTNEVESPAKRTRRSIESSESKNDSEEKPLEDKTCKKEVLKMVYNNICDSNKYLSTLERQIKDMSTENLSIVKSPVELKDIKKKIGLGDIKKIGDLQIHFLMMSYNAIMINRSDTIVFSDAANFQADLKDNCLVHQKAINSHCNDNSDRKHELNNKKRKLVDTSNNIEKNKHVNNSNVSIVIPHSDSDDFSDIDDDNDCDENNPIFYVPPTTTTVVKKMSIGKMLTCLDSSSEDLSDKECDKGSQKKGRKSTYSDNLSDNGGDSDDSLDWLF